MNRRTWNVERGTWNPRPSPHRLASIILAAGRSVRLGQPKALLQVSEREVAWSRILRQHLSCGLTPRLVASEELSGWVGDAGLPARFLIINREPQKGPLHSLQLALQELTRASGILLHPVDHPLVSKATVLALKTRHFSRPDCILIPTSNGRKGHPVVFPSRFFRDLAGAPLEQGARFVVRGHPGAVHHVEVRDEGIQANLNRPEDLRSWRNLGRWPRFPTGGLGTFSRSASTDRFPAPRPESHL